MIPVYLKMILVYLCTSTFLISHALGSDPLGFCPHNLQRKDLYAHGSYCYKVHYGDYGWHAARKVCLSQGGDLIQIRDAATQNYIHHALAGQRKEFDGFWIGATDIAVEQHWKWVSGNPSMHYTNWNSKEGPREKEPGFLFSDGMIEDCAMMRVNDNFKWHDHICDNFIFYYSFICQHKKIPQVHTTIKHIRTTKRTTPTTTTTSTTTTTPTTTTPTTTTTSTTTTTIPSTTTTPTTTTTMETVGVIIG